MTLMSLVGSSVCVPSFHLGGSLFGDRLFLGSVPTRVAAFGGLDVFKYNHDFSVHLDLLFLMVGHLSRPENRPSDADLQKYLGWKQAWEDIDPFTVIPSICLQA